jgi:HAD superfamily hydrolase (TIGR01662 family)
LIHTVLIDLGDTLVHLSRPWDEVFRDNLDSIYAYLKKAGLNSDFQEFAEQFIREFEHASATSQLYKVEVPMQDIVSRVLRKVKLGDRDETLVQNAIMEFYKPEIATWELYPDTKDTLTAFRDNGLKMGLISNAKSDWAVRAILEKHDLSKFFAVILTSAALHIRKPRLEVFMRALSALDSKPSTSVFIGDSLQADVIGAKTAGLRAIHVLRKPEDNSHFAVPDATVTSLTEALNRIVAWNRTSPSSIPSVT